MSDSENKDPKGEAAADGADDYKKPGVSRRDFAKIGAITAATVCLLYTSPSPRDRTRSRMPSSA